MCQQSIFQDTTAYVYSKNNLYKEILISIKLSVLSSHCVAWSVGFAHAPRGRSPQEAAAESRPQRARSPPSPLSGGFRWAWAHAHAHRGDALDRASPLPKQSTGLFWNSPLAEVRTLRGVSAVATADQRLVFGRKILNEWR